MPTPLRIIVYPVFGLFCLVLFSVLLFPFDSIKSRIAHELEAALGGEYAIAIKDLSPALLTGVVLKEVEIRPRGAPEGAAIKLSKAKLKFAPLALLGGTTEVDFDLRAGKGKAIGSFSWKRGGMELDLKMDRYDLAVTQILSQKAGIPISGVMSGTVELEIYPQDPLRNTGRVDLNIAEMKIGEINVGAGLLQLPPLQVAQGGEPSSKVEVVLNRGNFEVKAVKLNGTDLGLEASGKVYGARQVNNYRFNLRGNFKVAPQVAEKIPFLGVIEKQKTSEGSYPFTVTGRISKPSIRVGDFKVPI
jgi:type II secretion system protein N